MTALQTYNNLGVEFRLFRMKLEREFPEKASEYDQQMNEVQDWFETLASARLFGDGMLREQEAILHIRMGLDALFARLVNDGIYHLQLAA